MAGFDPGGSRITLQAQRKHESQLYEPLPDLNCLYSSCVSTRICSKIGPETFTKARFMRNFAQIEFSNLTEILLIMADLGLFFSLDLGKPQT